VRSERRILDARTGALDHAIRLLCAAAQTRRRGGDHRVERVLHERGAADRTVMKRFSRRLVIPAAEPASNARHVENCRVTQLEFLKA